MCTTGSRNWEIIGGYQACYQADFCKDGMAGGQKVCPVIGIGGIQSWEDAVEYFLAGASAIQVGTYNFVNPNGMIEILKGIEGYMQQHGMLSMKELIGSLEIE